MIASGITPALAQELVESRLDFRYELDCPPGIDSLGAVRGTVELADHRIRFDLYGGSTRYSLSIGRWTSPQPPVVTVSEFNGCTLKNFSTEVVRSTTTDSENQVQAWAERYSPAIVVRRDQRNNRETDVLLALAYSVLPDGKFTTIRYTAYFTGEDSRRTPRRTTELMTAYGRRQDIEWVYEIRLDSDGKPLKANYQGGIIGSGFGHASLPFRGDYLPGTAHPIVYNIARHNVFSDSPLFSTEHPSLYHFAHLPEIKSPEAREELLWREPWMFRATDSELSRERTLFGKSGEYLYARLAGNWKNGRGRLTLRLQDGRVFSPPVGFLDRLGENLYGTEGYSALRIPEKVRVGLLDGTLAGTLAMETERGARQDVAVEIRDVRLLTEEAMSFRVVLFSGLHDCLASDGKSDASCRIN